jgi:hypothetical protein
MTKISVASLILMLAAVATPFQAAEALKLENLSVRLTLATTGSPRGVHVGFVASNSSGGADNPVPIKILVRASGPSASVFGVTTANGVEIQQGSGVKARVLATWKESRSQIVAAANSVGAFPYGQGSGDEAMILEVPPGAFTVIVTAKEAGESIVEAYRLP